MHSFVHLLAGAILATTSTVQAFPSLGGLAPRDVFVPPTTCKTFGVGSTFVSYGNVCVGVSDGMVTVTYPTLQTGTYSASQIHVYIGETAPTDTAPGQFPYTVDKNFCSISSDGTSATCRIPVKDSWRACDKQLYIATHGSLTAGTGWGEGACYGKENGKGNGNCAKYWTFTTTCQCPVVIEYKPITSTTTCLTTITNVITSIVTPPPRATITGCNNPSAASPTTVTSTTTTSVDFTCPLYQAFDQ
ncbi:hypothetical protein FLONG3_4523 [Fusarium longipes]|uniref:Uncharacterized protein n=1 Tax=Fusarium longipes TaxID=694270 RepID=A0A395SY21_9HYPO|nr:hypothetical protein FLONG3_4523 [Fusarium longipes]